MNYLPLLPKKEYAFQSAPLLAFCFVFFFLFVFLSKSVHFFMVVSIVLTVSEKDGLNNVELARFW